MKYTPPLGKEENTPYIDGDPVAGIEGSPVPAAAIENPQREIENAIKKAGITPSTDNLEQLSAAIEKTAVNKAQIYGVPKGGIIMWSGATNQIPTGWTLCNGQNGTPNLADRFVLGAGRLYNVGAAGGAVDKTTTTAGNHYHSFSQTTSSNGNHAHSFSQTTSSNGNHSHRVNFWSSYHTLSVSQMPAHDHSYLHSTDPNRTNASSGGNIWSATTNEHTSSLSNKNKNGERYIGINGGSTAHRHALDGATHNAGAHTHTVSGNTNTAGAHTHSVSGNTNTTGNHSHKVNVLPPYYALAFIMKL